MRVAVHGHASLDEGFSTPAPLSARGGARRVQRSRSCYTWPDERVPTLTHTHGCMARPRRSALVHGRLRMIDALRRGRVSSRAPAKVSTARGASGFQLPAISYLPLGMRVTDRKSVV